MSKFVGIIAEDVSESIALLIQGEPAPEETQPSESASLIRRLREEVKNLNDENADLTRQLIEKSDQCERQKLNIQSIREDTSDMISDLNEDLHRAGEREAELLVKISDLEDEIRQLQSKVIGAFPTMTITADNFVRKQAEPEEKKSRPNKTWHKWTPEEDEWIRTHLNSATDLDVAEKFGVSQKAAYARMCKLRDEGGSDS